MVEFQAKKSLKRPLGCGPYSPSLAARRQVKEEGTTPRKQMETVPKTLARLLWMIRRWRIPFGILRTTELI